MNTVEAPSRYNNDKRALKRQPSALSMASVAGGFFSHHSMPSTTTTTPRPSASEVVGVGSIIHDNNSGSWLLSVAEVAQLIKLVLCGVASGLSGRNSSFTTSSLVLSTKNNNEERVLVTMIGELAAAALLTGCFSLVYYELGTTFTRKCM